MPQARSSADLEASAPSNPFQPFVPPPTWLRPNVRKGLARTPRPKRFGEIGKDDDDGTWEVASMMSASSLGGEGEGGGAAPFVPSGRDERLLRPMVRKPAVVEDATDTVSQASSSKKKRRKKKKAKKDGQAPAEEKNDGSADQQNEVK
ncbi:hypothetical protein JCM8097_001540 [Rhodosporidiobolus ruineniae]